MRGATRGSKLVSTMPASRQGTKSGRLKPTLAEPLVGEDSDHPADVDREDRAQEREVVDAGLRVAVVHPDLGRIAGAALEPVALHEEARHRAAGEAREHEPRRRTEHADLERVGDAALRGERRRPRDRRAVTAEQGHAAGEQPIAGARPSRVATATPSGVLEHHEYRHAASRMTSGRPRPSGRSTRALMPIVVKK